MALLISSSIWLGLLACFAVATAGNGDCPDGWVYSEDKCYKLEKTLATWQGAVDACKAIETILAEPNTATSNTFLKNIARTENSDIWLGATDQHKEGDWKWVGTNTPVVFNNWHPNNPDNHNNREHCLIFWKDFQFDWNDLPCHRKHFYICETESEC